MFRPQIQKTKTLIIMAILSYCFVIWVSQSATYISHHNQELKFKAVDIMQGCIIESTQGNSLYNYSLINKKKIHHKIII